MRTDPVSCKNATQYEIDNGKHLTWNDDRHCNPCQRVLDLFAAARRQAEAVEVAEGDEEPEVDEYVGWNTGVCAKCEGTGILGVGNNAHPSVYGMPCPDCEGDKGDEQ